MLQYQLARREREGTQRAPPGGAGSEKGATKMQKVRQTEPKGTGKVAEGPPTRPKVNPKRHKNVPRA